MREEDSTLILQEGKKKKKESNDSQVFIDITEKPPNIQQVKPEL